MRTELRKANFKVVSDQTVSQMELELPDTQTYKYPKISNQLLNSKLRIYRFIYSLALLLCDLASDLRVNHNLDLRK